MPFLALVPIAVWVSLAITVATTALQYGLAAMKKKPKPATFTFDDDTQSVYDPLAPWKILNGEGRTGGAVVFKKTNVAKTQMWMVVAIGPGPVKSLGPLWMGDEPIFLSGAADGSVQGRYATKLFCWTHLGDADQTVDTNLQAAFPEDWTDNHRLRGLAYFALKFVSDATLYGRGIPNPSIGYRGLSHQDPRTGETIYTDNPVVCIRSWLMNTVWGRRVPASRIDDASIGEEADHCDEIREVPHVFDYAQSQQARTFTASAATDALTFTAGFAGRDREHGLRYNDPVRVSSTTTLPPPLLAATTYYARPLTNSAGGFTCQLATSPTASTVIDITGAGAGTHTLLLQTYRLTLAGGSSRNSIHQVSDNVQLRDGAAGTENPLWARDGSKIVFTPQTGGTMGTPLVAGETYYCIETADPTIIQVAASVADAEAGTQINITVGSGGTVRADLKAHGGTFTADASTDTLTLSQDKAFRNGEVVYPETSGTLPAPLEAGRAYFWVRTGSTTGRMAETRWKALRQIYIDLTDAGSGTHTIFADLLSQSVMYSMPTGTVIQLDNTVAGTIGTGISLATDYYVISRGAGIIDLAATMADALADNPIQITAGVTTQTIHTVSREKERRFTMNGSFDTDTTYGEVLQAMLTSIGGYADPSGGEWRILPARYRVPEYTLDKDDVHGGPVELTTLLPARKTANTLTGVYTDPKNLDQPGNFPTLIDDDALQEDRGQTVQDEIVLPFTNTETMAIRLGLIDLNRRRRQKAMTFPTDLAGGWPVAVGDGVIIDLPGIGQNGDTQIYECTKWALTPLQPSDGGPAAPMISLSLRENDPFIYRQPRDQSA